MNDIVSLLLVDDNPSNLDVLASVLEPSGYRLVRAHSAEEALLALLDGEFAAIVLDIEMPGLNGLELAQLIKQRKRTRDVPILFLTAFHVDERDVLQGYGAGAVDYLSKPIHPEILRFKISVFAELFRKSRALAIANDALSREVSERVQAQDALREANELLERRVEERTAELVRAVDNERLARAEAEAQSRLKENFLAVISHELRTPLNAIYGWCKVLGRPGLDAAALARGLEVIERNALGQARLIEDLLDMSGIDSGRARLSLEPIDVLEVVRAAIQGIGPSAAGTGLVLEVDDAQVPLPPQRIVNGDPTRLQQVIGNLLNNALKFTPAGGRVTVRLRPVADRIEVTVEDSGEGIDAAALPHVFEKFWQADSSTGRRHGGLGLGLSIVRQLVAQHGGIVTADSEGIGRGARFTVTLPLASAAPARLDAQAPDPAASTGTAPADGTRLAGVRVLLVDDDVDALEVVRLLLGQHGAQVSGVKSAGEALLRLATDPFDVLVSDVGLPGQDGYGLIREWRSREPSQSRLPAVALTAFAGPEARRRALLEGFDDHVVKPIGLRTLVDVLGPLVGRGPERASHAAPSAPAVEPGAA